MFRCLTMTAVALATLLGLGFSASVGAEETVYCKRFDGSAYVTTSDSAACWGEDDKSIAKAEYEWWLNKTYERAEAAFQAHDYATAKNLYYDLYKNMGDGPWARAAHMLSVLLYQPFPGIEQDRSKAYELHQLALRKNDKLAQENEQEFKKKAFKTADIYEDLGEIGMSDDDLAEKAMELCFLYSRGWGVEINFAEARRWCIEAGKKGHPDADRLSMFVDNAYDVQKVSGLPFCRNHFMSIEEIGDLRDAGKDETELHNCLVAQDAYYSWDVGEYRNGDRNGIHTSLGKHNDGCFLAEYGNYVDNFTFVGSMIFCNPSGAQPGYYYVRGKYKTDEGTFTGRLIGPDGVVKTGNFGFMYGIAEPIVSISELWDEELEMCVKDGPGSRQTHGKYTGGSALWLGLSEQNKKFQCALRLGSLSLQELWSAQ